MKISKNILAIASLIGTIIGAGVFGIPYVFSKSGVLPCLFYFLILGTIVVFLHLFFGEIILRTEEKHRLVGYAEKYLGKKAKGLVAFSTIIGTIGALLVYIILTGAFLKTIFPSAISAFQFSVIAWVFLSLLVLLGIKIIVSAELLMNIGLFVVIFIVFIFTVPKIKISNFILTDFSYFFLPFGIFLFSLIGWNAVPEVSGILEQKKGLKKVIIFASIICLVFYVLFGLIVSGVTGPKTTPEALNGLASIMGQKIMVLGGIFGLLAVATSFLILGNYLKNTLIFDYRLSPFLAFLITCFLPLFLFLAGIREFIQVIGIVGILVGVVEGAAIVLIYKKAKKNGDRIPEYSLRIPDIFLYFIIIVLIFGAISEIIHSFVRL